MSAPQDIASRDNPLLKRLRLLAHDSTAHRKHGQVWLEGEQLDWPLLQHLRLSHPITEQVAVDRVTVLRQGVVLQER